MSDEADAKGATSACDETNSAESAAPTKEEPAPSSGTGGSKRKLEDDEAGCAGGGSGALDDTSAEVPKKSSKVETKAEIKSPRSTTVAIHF